MTPYEFATCLKLDRRLLAFAAGRSRADLDEDDMLAFALMKAIEVIGEAAGKVSSDSKERFNEIPWQQIVGMRNRLIHAYEDISLDILWQTVTSNLPHHGHNVLECRPQR